MNHMADAFETAWSLIKQPELIQRPPETTVSWQQQPSKLGELMGIGEEEDTSQTTGGGDDDECCEKARGDFRSVAIGLATNRPEDQNRLKDFLGDIDSEECDNFRGFLKVISNPQMRGLNDRAESMGAAAEHILQEWDECEQNKGGGTDTPPRFSEDMSMYQGEPMDISFRMLKDGPPDLFDESGKLNEPPDLFGGSAPQRATQRAEERAEEADGPVLSVQGHEGLDKERFQAKMNEWIGLHGKPSRIISPYSPGAGMQAEMWASMNDVPHSKPSWDKKAKQYDTDATHHLLFLDPGEGMSGKMHNTLATDKPVHIDHTHKHVDNPLQEIRSGPSKPKQKQTATEPGQTLESDARVEEPDKDPIVQILGPRPDPPTPGMSPMGLRHKAITAIRARWDADAAELRDAMGVTEEEKAPKRKRGSARRGGRPKKDDGAPDLFGTGEPMDLAWRLLKIYDAVSDLESYLRELRDVLEKTRVAQRDRPDKDYNREIEEYEAIYAQIEEEIENMKTQHPDWQRYDDDRFDAEEGPLPPEWVETPTNPMWDEKTGFTTGEPMDLSFRMLKYLEDWERDLEQWKDPKDVARYLRRFDYDPPEEEGGGYSSRAIGTRGMEGHEGLGWSQRRPRAPPRQTKTRLERSPELDEKLGGPPIRHSGQAIPPGAKLPSPPPSPPSRKERRASDKWREEQMRQRVADTAAGAAASRRRANIRETKRWIEESNRKAEARRAEAAAAQRRYSRKVRGFSAPPLPPRLPPPKTIEEFMANRPEYEQQERHDQVSDWEKEMAAREGEEWTRTHEHLGEMVAPTKHPGTMLSNEDLEAIEQGVHEGPKSSVPIRPLYGDWEGIYGDRPDPHAGISIQETEGSPISEMDPVTMAALRGDIGRVEHRIDIDPETGEPAHGVAAGVNPHEVQQWIEEHGSDPAIGFRELTDLSQVDKEKWLEQSLARMAAAEGVIDAEDAPLPPISGAEQGIKERGTFAGLPWDEESGFTTGEPMDLAFRMLKSPRVV